MKSNGFFSAFSDGQEADTQTPPAPQVQTGTEPEPPQAPRKHSPRHRRRPIKVKMSVDVPLGLRQGLDDLVERDGTLLLEEIAEAVRSHLKKKRIAYEEEV